MAAPLGVVNPTNNFIIFQPIAAGVGIGTPGTVLEDCCDDGEFCLPVVKNDDLKFQFRRVFTTQAEAFAIAQADGKIAQLCILKGTGNTAVTAPGNMVDNLYITWGYEFQKTITGDREVTFYWNNPIPLPKDCDQCYQLALIIHNDPDDESQDITHVSNCIKKICDDCYTSVIEFSCDDDAYDWRYCQFDDGAANRVRLPFYLYQPQIKTEKKIFVRSDGSSQVTSSVSMQEWTGLVDYIPREVHASLTLALEHDTVIIECTNAKFNDGFRCNNDYTIDWTDESDCVAQAKFKGNTTPYNMRNTNCQVCAECPEIVNFQLNNFFATGGGQLSFTFTYDVTGPAPGFVILEYKLTTDTSWSQSIQANISPINLLLPPGVYDFRMIPVADNCLPDYTAEINAVGDDDPVTCPPVEGLLIEDITSTSATGQWNANLPTPANLYDWILYLGDGVTVVNSGTGYWNPGTLILALAPLTPNTGYILSVVAHCEGSDVSDIRSVSFFTLP